VSELNVQNQQKIEWPAKLVVAKAYVDQLERSKTLPADQIASLRKAIDTKTNLKHMAETAEKTITSATSPADTARLRALAAILKNPAK
jgi:hypothetical protein